MIREMKESDRERIIEIYSRGIESGRATFNTDIPSYDEWDKAHIKECRYVYEENGTAVGFIVLSRVSQREAYKGVAEVSLYIDENYHRKGIGKALTDYICEKAPEYGFWSLLSVIFASNAPSLALIRKCGFREIGYRERIAKDRFGEWQNTIMFEKRLEEKKL